MSSSDLTRSKRLAVAFLVALVAGGPLGGCARTPQQKMVYVQWRALLVYHPLWDALSSAPPPLSAGSVGSGTAPTVFSLPEWTIQPMQTAEAEIRRRRLVQTVEQQQQALTTRLQQMEARLSQEELNQLDMQQRAQAETARQQIIRQAEQEVDEALRQYQPQLATAEIRKRVIQRLMRVRPDQRDTLSARLKEMEADQQVLSGGLLRRLKQIEEETSARIREHIEAIEKEYARKREELLEQSAKRLQAEQTRAGLQIRAFANGGEPLRFAHIAVTLPPEVRRKGQPPARPTPAQEDLRPVVEQDVKRWVEAICRRCRWLPVWHTRAGVPDVTAQIAQQMRGGLR